MVNQKPFAQSSEENKHVILEQLEKIFSTPAHVLEIGSGTGQHAVFFADKLPYLRWQPSDLAEALPGIQLWLDEAALDNILPPAMLDVAANDWGFEQPFDAAFTANTLHIMSLQHVEKCFLGLGNYLSPEAIFCSYGPFNYNGQFSSESNARFDLWLKQRDPRSGIRDLQQLITFAEAGGIELIDDIEMPVNNRLLVWKKR